MTTVGSSASDSSPEKLGTLKAEMEKFRALYPTQDDCRVAIFTVIRELGLSACPHCGSKEFDETTPKRSVSCSKCKETWWITANTFFDRVRNFEAWLAAIWLLEQKIEFNIREFEQLLNIAYSTAWNLITELRIALEKEMDDQTREVPSELFEKLIGRRTRETPAGQHPREEKLPCMKKKDNSDFKNALSMAVEEYGLNVATASSILSLLSADIPKDVDWITDKLKIEFREIAETLTILEMQELVIRRDGDLYFLSQKSNQSPKPNAESMEDAVVFEKFVKNLCQSVGLKYLQLYAAFHWCLTARDEKRYGRLLYACARARPLSPFDIKYISPKAVIRLAKRSSTDCK